MTHIVYRYGCTFATKGDKVLWYRGHRPAWLMRLLMLWPAEYVDAQ